MATTYTYDALGRLRTVAPPGAEAVTTITYNSTTKTTVTRADTTQITIYDGFGRPQREIRAMPTGFAVRTRKYDKGGHPYFVSEWKSCTSDTGDCLTANPGGTTLSSFDPFGRAETITKADSTVTTISRVDGSLQDSDSREAVTESVNGSNATTARRRDPLGRVITVQEPLVNGSADLTTYKYNALDALTDVTQTSNLRSFTNDSFGFLRAESTPEKGSVTYSSYDALGDLLSETEPGSLLVSRVFDAAGRLQKVTSGSQVYVRDCYDGAAVACVDAVPNFSGGSNPKSRLTRRYGYNPVSVPAATFTEDFTYSNVAGRLSQKALTFGGGLTLSTTQNWLYNSLGLVSTRSHGSFAIDTTYTKGLPTKLQQGVSPIVSTVAYNPAGGVASWTAGNTVVTTITQDSTLMPRPSQISTTGATGIAGNFNSGTYVYDGVGNITQIGTDVFTYDARSRLKTANYPGTGSETYSYDLYGNMTSKVQTTSGTTTYNFCGATCASNKMSATYGYGYDARGNLTANGSEVLTFDGLDRQRLDVLGTSNWTYIIDGGNERVAKVPSTSSPIYTLRDENNRFLTEYVGATLGRDNIYLGDLLVASYVSSTLSGTLGWNYYHSDHLGTPRLVTDINHDSVETPAGGRKYWPFGDGVPANPGTMQRIRFASMERDSEADRYYDHARHHLTIPGRFISPDKVGGRPRDPQSWNRYSYARNSPLKLIDPNGLCSAPAGTGNGTIGFCVEAFIAARRIGGVGLGDNRAFSGIDPSLTARIRVDVLVNQKTGLITTRTTPGESDLFVKGLGRTGTAKTTVSNAQRTTDGATTFSLDMTGKNGVSLLPGAPKDPIDIHLNLRLDPSGNAGIDSGSRRDAYPSVGVYEYQPGQENDPSILYEGKEGKPEDLAPPMEQVIPTCDNSGRSQSGPCPR